MKSRPKRQHIALRLAEQIDESLKKQRARTAKYAGKPMTREQFIQAVLRDQERRALS